MGSEFNALGDEVAEQVLFQPCVLVDYHEFLLGVDVEVIGSLAV